MDQQPGSTLWQENRAFFQGNLVKGGRYLDDAGRILNDYVESYQDYNIGLQGLHLINPKRPDIPDEIAVNVDRLWLAYFGEDCVDRVLETAAPIAKAICKHIAVESYSRLGLRVQYFKRVEDVEAYSQKLLARTASDELRATLGLTEGVTGMGLRVNYLERPFSVSLLFNSVKTSGPPAKKADYVGDGGVFDIDVAEHGDSSSSVLSPAHVAGFLRQSSERVRAKARDIIVLVREAI